MVLSTRWWRSFTNKSGKESEVQHNRTDSSQEEIFEGDVMSEKENDAQLVDSGNEPEEERIEQGEQLNVLDSIDKANSDALNHDNSEKIETLSEKAKLSESSVGSVTAPEIPEEMEEVLSASDNDSLKDDEETSIIDELEADDPLGEAYDLEKGEKIPNQVHNDGGRLPWKSKIESAKEFFNTEILYRHDILLNEERERLSGKYRIELKGYQGGIWSLDVGDDIEIINRREEADVVIAMQQKDFLQVVNGELNPQLALLSRKIKVTGDIKKAVALQSLLAPAME